MSPKGSQAGHFDAPRISLLSVKNLVLFYFDHISRHFRSICNFFCHKLAIFDDRKSLHLSCNRISRYFISICNSFFFTKWRPFWMTEITFFAISDRYATLILFKMAASGYFGSRFLPLYITVATSQYEVDRCIFD